jgi:hypothetical protein
MGDDVDKQLEKDAKMASAALRGSALGCRQFLDAYTVEHSANRETGKAHGKISGPYHDLSDLVLLNRIQNSACFVI